MAQKTVTFGNNFISIEDIFAISQQKKIAKLNQEKTYIEKIEKGADFLKDKLAKDGVIYGVTTGYGDSCTVAIPKNLHEKLPINLARFHGCGLGKHFEPDVTRAIIAVRLCSLSKGFSAVRYELLQHLERFLNDDILPLIPEEGSVGASGDLTPLSYIARALIGEEKVLYKDQIYLSSDLFKKLNYEALTLKPKEGLALMNGTSVMTAIACIAHKKADYLAKLCSRITAMASLGLKGNAFHFDELLFSLKPHPGQTQIAKWIRDDLATSEELQRHGVHSHEFDELRLQDRYSIRCAPHIIGVLADSLPFFKTLIETEINSSNDNPLIDPESEKIMHGGHFYGGHIAFAMDSLKNVVANLADMMDRQMALLVDEKFNNGLPKNLSGQFGEEKNINHGLKALQIGVSAWCAEALKNTMPASVFSRSTECHNQDKVSMGTIAARDCIRILELTTQIAAALLITVTQAISLRIKQNEISEKDLTQNLGETFRQLQNDFEFLDHDRPLEPVLRKIIENIHQEKYQTYEN